MKRVIAREQIINPVTKNYYDDCDLPAFNGIICGKWNEMNIQDEQLLVEFFAIYPQTKGDFWSVSIERD